MPGPVGRTRLQSRKDVHQPRLFPALLEDLLDAVFFAKILLANVLDLQTIGLGDRFSLCTDLFMQRLRKPQSYTAVQLEAGVTTLAYGWKALPYQQNEFLGACQFDLRFKNMVFKNDQDSLSL